MKIWIGLICATMGTIAVGRSDTLSYSPDGGLVAFGAFTYSYDSATRLTEVWSNDVKVAEHQYDAFGRRVRKITPNAVRTFVYDGWLPLLEIVEYTGGRVERIDYCWGKDISGTLDGAGGVGGLLYLRRDRSEVFIPLFDATGNVLHYIDASGNVVASYVYDAFGNTVAKDGPMANEFHMRFATRYYDDESQLYYFGKRFYSPRLSRWMSRDPEGEDGGLNLYVSCHNDMVNNVDPLGTYTLADAQGSLTRRGVPKTRRVGLSWIYFDAEIFDEWLRLERLRGNWWSTLPKCPCSICVRKDGTAKNPDSRKWKDPAKGGVLLRRYHPGGVYEMRSKPVGGHGNQCVYDAGGNLLEGPVAGGTVDYYAPGWDVLWGHQPHDVATWELARDLGRIPDYYLVRPSW